MRGNPGEAATGNSANQIREEGHCRISQSDLTGAGKGIPGNDYCIGKAQKSMLEKHEGLLWPDLRQ